MKFSDIPIKLLRWDIEGEPPRINKYVLVAGKHTSNWDYFIMLAAAYKLGVKPFVFIKKEAFLPLVGALLRMLGGIAVDRANPQSTIEAVVKNINDAKSFMLIIAPEGTRNGDGTLKTGFYRIAKQVNIPILPVTIHSDRRAIRIHGLIDATDKTDVMQHVAKLFSESRGVRTR